MGVVRQDAALYADRSCYELHTRKRGLQMLQGPLQPERHSLSLAPNPLPTDIHKTSSTPHATLKLTIIEYFDWNTFDGQASGSKVG
ncbi:hypothetical protein NPIL_267491 [Nephila pilipes]|uniref:Uncharacterized protein n=1 Tax=Nephila pilipes TaxID=299642 RepID=A0A8X6MPZ0_NEPPI|nr:hypothetical protein NPIL_267491 [Nephila pilipes]